MASPMQRVSSIVSSDISNYLTNRKTWGDILYNVRSYGAQGDGIVDDTAAIQRVLDTVAASGGIAFFPQGTYRITEALLITDAAEPFSIIGAGRELVTLIRDSDLVGTLLTIAGSDGVEIRDISLNCKHSLYPNGNHGIALGECNNVLIQRVNVTDWKNTAIIHVTPSDGIVRENVIIDDCIIDGLNNSNNGFLLSTLKDSGIQNSKALNIGRLGSPCYALQLKNTATRCWISNCVATGATAGVAFGQETASTAVTNSRVDGVSIFGCDYGILLGYAENNNFSNINIDMNNPALATIHAISLSFSLYNNFSGIQVENLGSGVRLVDLNEGSDYNMITVDLFRNSNNTAVPFRIRTSSNNNTIVLNQMSGSQPTFTQNLISDEVNDGTNVFLYQRREPSCELTISSGAISLPHSLIRKVKIDTEGGAASDDLTTINNGVDGQIITLCTQTGARDVMIKHGTGNIALNGSVDFTLSNVADTLTLIYNSSISRWCESGRGVNA